MTLRCTTRVTKINNDTEAHRVWTVKSAGLEIGWGGEFPRGLSERIHVRLASVGVRIQRSSGGQRRGQRPGDGGRPGEEAEIGAKQLQQTAAATDEDDAAQTSQRRHARHLQRPRTSSAGQSQQ